MAQTPRGRTGQRVLAAVALIVCLAAPLTGIAAPVATPAWAELSQDQRTVLAPLANDWDDMEFWRRGKWVEIAQRYPTMSPEEQLRIQDRMRAWAKLTPEERRAARHIFKNVQQATPEQREALKQMWAEYEALPEAEKQKLKEKAQAAKAPVRRAPSAAKPTPKLPVPPPPPPKRLPQ